MADVAIDSAVLTTTESAIGDGRWQVTTDKDTVYAFFASGSDFDLYYKKSTDGGANWAAAVSIRAATSATFTVWYDKWTPGDSGTKIHIWYVDHLPDDLFYRSLDTATDTLGTEATVHSAAGSAITANSTLSGCKAVGGNLYVGACFDPDGEAAFNVFYRSVDAGANWTSRTSPIEVLGDHILLFPANLADTNDIWAVYEDISATELSLKTYDNSANNWTGAGAEAVIDADFAATTHASSNPQFAGSIRHSDGAIGLAYWSAFDASTADFRFCIILNRDSITAKTAIITDADDCFGAAVFIDQNTDDIYVGYLGDSDGTDTALATVQVHYKKSGDGGTTWDAEVQYSEDTADDFRCITCDLGGTSALMSFAWYDDDDNDIFFGVTNSIEITAPAAAGTVGMLMMAGVGT